MMEKFCYLFAAFLTVVSCTANANANSACDGFVCEGKISAFAESLVITPTDMLITVMPKVDTKPLSCQLVEGKFITIPGKGKNADAVYSMLLTAFAANSHVKVILSNTTKQCEIHVIELISSF